MKGKVYLVGAGPGDPDLLTQKALRLLKTADAVLHDDLVSEEILSLVSPAARLQNVGKRCGAKTITQAEINFLMVTSAASGLTVVRLKSGDPLIFGRSAEEMAALARAGIPCELVPGVTAALGAAAAAQIPLTHRQVSHALVLLPGQVAGESDFPDWGKLAASGATLAIYMPGHNYAQLAARLLHAGLARTAPCAMISSATSERQSVALCLLGELPSLRPVRSPALLLIGEVVRFARTPVPSIPGLANNDVLRRPNRESLPRSAASLTLQQEILAEHWNPQQVLRWAFERFADDVG
ncbi:MAG TPA: uroporphyrinogen-III C-methyltransferase [Terriglobales bacterium]|nr:uroporphyrinogen-III C-methyltransferase [Terriglobales bacterium]